jgi:recombination protein RecR
MPFIPNALDRLITFLTRLPGVGKKSAARMAYYILDKDQSYANSLANELGNIHKAIKRCNICGGFTEHDPCSVCSDTTRDHSIICIVEKAQDLRTIEEANEFTGVYHVLGGLIAPLDGVTPENLNINKLMMRINQKSNVIKELILALNPTVEGDTTSLYLQRLFKNFPITVSRLASGLPVGGDLEYTDRLTLSRSFRGRIQMH